MVELTVTDKVAAKTQATWKRMSKWLVVFCGAGSSAQMIAAPPRALTLRSAISKQMLAIVS